MEERRYMDTTLTPGERAKELLSLMTLEEKIAQMNITRGVEYAHEPSPYNSCSVDEGTGFDMEKFASLVGDRGIGYMHDIYSVPEVKNVLQRYLVEKTRLGIPCIFTAEALHGVGFSGASIFPMPLVLSQSFDPQVAYETGSCIAAETRCLGHQEILAPNLDVAREPRWGRTEETFGEDTYLTTKMGVAIIKGEQKGDISRKDSVITEPKHYCAHGLAEGGLNCAPARAGVREVETEYLPVFEAAIKEGGAYNVMACYNSVDSSVVISDKKYLTDILKDRLGLRGISRADWGAVSRLKDIHFTQPTYKDCVRAVVKAGLDMQGCNDIPEADYERYIKEMVLEGEIPEAQIDESVLRILEMKFELGLFEDPYGDSDAYKKVIRCEKHREVSLNSARKGIALIKNDGTLPLKNVKKIAVLGPSSNAQKLGGYSSAVRGYEVRSVYDEIKSRPEGFEVRQCDGCAITKNKSGEDVQYIDGQPHLTKKLDADIEDMIEKSVEIARGCDVAVLVCGDNIVTSGEGMDRCSLTLAGRQRELIEKVAATGVPTVLVLENGKSTELSVENEVTNAILVAGFGGEFGARAITDALFGDINPAGRLTVSYPRDCGMLPCYYTRHPGGMNQYMEGSSEALFPFGHGLSYTEFEYSELETEKTGANDFKITFTLKNTGSLSGDEVAQLYVNDVYSSVVTPLRQLRGFERVTLEPGESKKITFTLGFDELKLLNGDMQWVVESGDFEVMIGSSSRDIRLTATVTV